MKIVNGQAVPEGLSLGELKKMMESPDMQTFAVACEALQEAKTTEAYALLKRYIAHADPYRRRCVLAVIFNYPEAAELISHLEQALGSEKSFLVGTALDVIIQGKARVSDDVLLACMEKNPEALRGYTCLALRTVSDTQRNVQRILTLYRGCQDESARIGLAECLHSFCNAENHMELYRLFQNDPAPHIRILACRIAKEYRHPQLLEKFTQDQDGHIHKLARSE